MRDTMKKLTNGNNGEVGVFVHKQDIESSLPPHNLPRRMLEKRWVDSGADNFAPSKLRVNSGPLSSFRLPYSNRAQTDNVSDMDVQSNLGMEPRHMLTNTSRMGELEILSVLDTDFSELSSSTESSESVEDGAHLQKMGCIPLISRNKTTTSQEFHSVPVSSQLHKLGDNRIENTGFPNPRPRVKLPEGVRKPPQPNSLELSARKMTKEIMRYEIRLSSLYGKMTQIKKENQELRDNLKLVSDRNVSLIVSLWKRSNNGRNDAFCLADSEDEPSAKMSSVYGHNSDSMESRKNDDLRQMLSTLKRRINKQVKEYKAAQKDLKAKLESYHANEKTQKSLLTEESPLIKNLRSKLATLHNELKRVKGNGNVRVANLKGALLSEKANRMALYKKLEESQSYITDSSKYVTEAAKHLKQHQQTIENQRKKISMLQKKTSDESLSEPPVHPTVDRQHTSEKFNTLATENNALLKLVQTQKNDITILNELLDGEKLKNKTLLRTLDCRDTRPAPRNSSSNAEREDNDRYENLSQQYLDLLEQQAFDKQKYRDRIQEIHKLYRAILNSKDCEHHAHMSSLSSKIQTIHGQLSIDGSPVPHSLVESTTDLLFKQSPRKSKDKGDKIDEYEVQGIELAEQSN